MSDLIQTQQRLGELSDHLELALALALPDSQQVIECNQRFVKRCLAPQHQSDHHAPPIGGIFPKLKLALLEKALAAGRVYRYKQLCKKGTNPFPIDFVFSRIMIEEQHYILIQGTDNKESLEMHGIISSYEQVFKQQTQLLTEEKEKSQAANLAKATFLSLMSHELRTPLNAILGFAQIQQFRLADNPELMAGNQRIVSASNHLLELIIEMLNFVELEEQQLEMQMTSCDLNHCLATSIEDYTELQQINNVSIRCPTTNFKVRGDEKRLIQVIKHLLCNAIKFNQPNGSVNISVTHLAQRQIEIAIEDTGVGIGPADQERLFEPFFRTEYAKKQCIGGIGIGLTVCKKMAEMMEGSITFVNNNQHHAPDAPGMTFFLRLQAAPSLSFL